MATTMDVGFDTGNAGVTDRSKTSSTAGRTAGPIGIAPAEVAAPAPLAFVFTATGSGYFRIRTVNRPLPVADRDRQPAADLRDARLFWPFAVVRSMRRRREAVSCDGHADQSSIATAANRVGAAAYETADPSGFDFAP